jgi:4-hydroxy-3-polyprenylbenzoate decarboxylase
MASVTKVNLKEDELRFASCFQGGKSVEIIRCETNDIHVPADSEIVLEGDLLLNEQVLEGPLAEYSGYFEERMTTLTMKIKCITHKRAPVFVTTTAGHVHSEEEVMRVIQQNATVHSLCRQRVTGFVRAGLPQAGRGYTAVVAINKRVPGWGKHAIQQAYSVPYIALQCNNIIVVDEDIDPLDGDQVLWALSTRVDPERDVIIFPPAGVNPLNPAARYRPQTFDPTKITDVAVCSKMGIDATLKVFGELEGHARPVSRPVKPNPQVYEKICAEWAQYGF